GQTRGGVLKFIGLENLPQADHVALGVGDFDADGRLPRDTLNENRFGLQAQTEVFGERGDAAVFDAGVRLEFEGRDHRAGVDLHHRSEYVELLEFGLYANRRVLDLLLVELAADRRLVQQIGVRKMEDGVLDFGFRISDVGCRMFGFGYRGRGHRLGRFPGRSVFQGADRDFL